MADLILREIDAEQLRSDIAAEVIAAIRPLLNAAAEPRLVDRHRMAELLSVSVPTLDRLTSDGAIPSVMIGTRRLYRPVAVIDTLSKTAVPAKSQT